MQNSTSLLWRLELFSDCAAPSLWQLCHGHWWGLICPGLAFPELDSPTNLHVKLKTRISFSQRCWTHGEWRDFSKPEEKRGGKRDSNSGQILGLWLPATCSGHTTTISNIKTSFRLGRSQRDALGLPEHPGGFQSIRDSAFSVCTNICCSRSAAKPKNPSPAKMPEESLQLLDFWIFFPAQRRH